MITNYPNPFEQLLAARRKAEYWRRCWVWTFGVLLVAIVAIAGLIAGRA